MPADARSVAILAEGDAIIVLPPKLKYRNQASHPVKDDPYSSPGATPVQRSPLGRSLLGKCRRVYDKARASFRQPKRELVVYRVEEVCDRFQDAKAQFQVTLEQFSAISHFQDGHLEDRYRQFKRNLEQSEAIAKAVRERIQGVEQVAEALFEEWEGELDLYSSRNLRSNSRQKLKSTQQHYSRLIKAMQRAEARIPPVLTAFKDQVLFLKHNLNAQAIASLHTDMVAVRIDIAALISAMERSIYEANAFVNCLSTQKVLPSRI
jgi:hypothetical protein